MTQNTISNDFLVVHLCMSAHMTGNHRCREKRPKKFGGKKRNKNNMR